MSSHRFNHRHLSVHSTQQIKSHCPIQQMVAYKPSPSDVAEHPVHIKTSLRFVSEKWAGRKQLLEGAFCRFWGFLLTQFLFKNDLHCLFFTKGALVISVLGSLGHNIWNTASSDPVKLLGPLRYASTTVSSQRGTESLSSIQQNEHIATPHSRTRAHKCIH